MQGTEASIGINTFENFNERSEDIQKKKKNSIDMVYVCHQLHLFLNWCIICEPIQ